MRYLPGNGDIYLHMYISSGRARIRRLGIEVVFRVSLDFEFDSNATRNSGKANRIRSANLICLLTLRRILF